MDNHTEGLHHLSVRRRIHKKHEKYPHPNKLKRFIDRSAYGIGIIGPIMTLPQVIKIWVGKNAAGLALISWCTYLVVAIFWLTYGMMHKEKPLILMYTSWIIMHILIITGIILYG